MHFGHLNFDPGVMLVAEIAELGLLSFLVKLVVLKSFAFEEIILTVRVGCYYLFFFEQASHYSSVDLI